MAAVRRVDAPSGDGCEQALRQAADHRMSLDARPQGGVSIVRCLGAIPVGGRRAKERRPVASAAFVPAPTPGHGSGAPPPRCRWAATASTETASP